MGKDEVVEGVIESQQESDPYGVSYPESAAKHLLYRIIITLFAMFMVIIGKSNLPDDSVTCIQDTVINFLMPVTNYYKENLTMGLALMSIMQILVDLELIAMMIFWYFKGNSFRYPLLLSVLGLSKILLNVLFQVRPIQNAFNEMLFPSLCFGQNFKNTYFFSGIITFLFFNLQELRKLNYWILMKVQILVIIFCIWMLLSMRQNFFMDIATGLVFGHIVFRFINEKSNQIDKWIGSFFVQENSLFEK